MFAYDNSSMIWFRLKTGGNIEHFATAQGIFNNLEGCKATDWPQACTSMPDCSFPSCFPFFCFAALFFGSIIVQVQDMLIHLHDNNSKKINTMHQEFKIGTNYRKEIISRIKPLIPMSSPLTSDRPKSEGHTCLISYNIFMDLSICLMWTFFIFWDICLDLWWSLQI